MWNDLFSQMSAVPLLLCSAVLCLDLTRGENSGPGLFRRCCVHQRQICPALLDGLASAPPPELPTLNSDEENCNVNVCKMKGASSQMSSSLLCVVIGWICPVCLYPAETVWSVTGSLSECKWKCSVCKFQRHNDDKRCFEDAIFKLICKKEFAKNLEYHRMWLAQDSVLLHTLMLDATICQK